MSKSILIERKKRMQKLFRVLKGLFPVRRTMLVYKNPFELLIAVILSAQCTDKQVNKVTPKLFKKYPTPSSLAKAPLKNIESIIYTTGFFKIKAKRIKTCAKELIGKYDGKVPKDFHKLITLPGVGRKTANVVLGNAFGIKSGIAVDTHVKRFAIKFNLTDHTNPDKIEHDLKQLIPQRHWTDAAYYMISYGREICPARKHDCKNHPCTKIYPLAATIWPKSK